MPGITSTELHITPGKFGTHYHKERAHQGLGNRPPAQDENAVILPFTGAEVKCRERLGGLLKHYFCEAA